LETTELVDCFPETLTYYRSRKQFAFCDVVALANLVDPRYRGVDLSNDEKISARKLLTTLGGDDILLEFQEFIVKSSRKNREIFIETLTSDPLVWWEATGGLYYPKLCIIAEKVLSIVCNSASSERIWSKFSLLHSKIRNKMQSRTTIVLCIIYAWLRMKHSEGQRRPHLKPDFILSRFEANDPDQDISVVTNIEDIVGDVSIDEDIEEIMEDVAELSDRDLDIIIQELTSDLGVSADTLLTLEESAEKMLDSMEEV